MLGQTTPVLTLPDLSVTVAKSISYFQPVTGPALLSTNPLPYGFQGNAGSFEAGLIKEASLRLPSGIITNLSKVDDKVFGLFAQFSHKTALDAAFSNGVYQFRVRLTNGLLDPSLTLPPDAYPPTPRIRNLPDAQNIDPSADFVLEWSDPVGTNKPFVSLAIMDTQGHVVTNAHSGVGPDALDDTRTSFVIAAGTLTPGRPYFGMLWFVQAVEQNSPTVYGTIHYQKNTVFPMLAASNAPAAGRFLLATSAQNVGETSGVATVTVVRSGGSLGAASVHLATRDSTATAGMDYGAISQPMDFTDGQTIRTVTIPILDDPLLEGTESFRVMLSSPTSGAILGNPSNQVIRILDNENAQAGILEFKKSFWTTSETGGVAKVALVRSGGTNGTVCVDVTLGEEGGSFANVMPMQTNVCFAPGVTNAAIRGIQLLDDTLSRSNPPAKLVMNNPSGGAALGLLTNAWLWVTNDDLGGTLRLSGSRFVVSEGGIVIISVLRTGGAASDVTVDYAVSGTNGIDAIATNGTLTFGAGQTSNSFSVSIPDNPAPDGLRFETVTLSRATGGATLGARSQATLAIVDDETVVQLASGTATVSEDAGTLVMNVERRGATNGTVIAYYTTQNGTALAGTDYQATPGLLTFVPGVTQLPITVPLIGNTVVDLDRSFRLCLTNVTGIKASLGTPACADLTITNDDQGGMVVFTTRDFSVCETGRWAWVSLRRTNGLASGVSVRLSTADGSATSGVDYSGIVTNLEFGAGMTAVSNRIRIWNNARDQSNRTVNLALTEVQGGASFGKRTNAVLTIVDDDAPGVLGFSAAVYSASEGQSSVLITVVRTGGNSEGVTVNYEAVAGTAQASQDFTPKSGTLTFGSNQTTASFSIVITNDALYEPPETVLLRLRGPTGGATLGASSNAVLTINSDDVPGVLSFSCPTYALPENTSGDIWITVYRSGGTAGGVSVAFRTVNGTAIAGSDYEATNGVLTFAPSQTNAAFRLRLKDDCQPENDETLHLLLSNPTGGATLGAPVGAVVTILNDDVQSVISLSATNYSVAETGGGIWITATRTGGVASAVTVQYETLNGTATAGSDYTRAAGTLTFAPSQATASFRVPVTDDSTDEPNETVLLRLSNPTGCAALGASPTATLVIQDDEATLAGTYKVTGSYSSQGCLDPIDNLNSAFRGDLTMSNRGGNWFDGEALFITTDIGGYARFYMSGAVDGIGGISGTYTAGSDASGTFTGSLSDGRLQVSFGGGQRYDTCRDSGTISGNPYSPPAGGFASHSVNGYSVYFVITSGSGLLPSYGSLVFRPGVDTYSSTAISGPIGSDYGVYTYTKTGPNSGSMVACGEDGFFTTITTLTFTTATSGTYTTSASQGLGSGAGTFTIVR